MISQDARRLPAVALEELRRRAVAAVHAGGSRAEVARLFGVSRRTVGSWVLSFRDNGEDAFRARPRGRRPGEQLALSVSEQEATVKTIFSGMPEDVGLPYWVWTKPAIAEFVNREYRVTLSTTTVGQYLIRWDLIPAVNLLELLRENEVVGRCRTVAPGRAVDVVWLARTRPLFGEVSVLLAVGNRGTLYFDVLPDPFGADQIADFLHRLTAQTGRALEAILCRGPVRESEAVRTWPEDLAERLLSPPSHEMST
jgi:transposase